jgi:sphingomyelin phosphodiesterase acid-like 3
MLSDIHLDPFHDPGKVEKLNDAPVSEWHAILDAPESPGQALAFEKLQSVCHARGVDTPWALLKSSLADASSREGKPAFVTVSGDLMAHEFDCRFHTLAAGDDAAYSRFAEKTVAFVVLEVRQAFLGVPVYFALGNNDSGCGDYREDAGSAFLIADGQSFGDAVIEKQNRNGVLREFSAEGDYAATLPKPMSHAKLIVLQDIFESARYSGCGKTPSAVGNMTPAQVQLAWLRQELTVARTHHEHVWLLAHIPPGVDAYSTFTHGGNVCKGAEPVMFLGSEELAKTITGFADVITLALFGHTHMDEMRLYRSGSGHVVPGKITPSITPVNGNLPAFAVAKIDPRRAVMVDYTMYVAKNVEGSVWKAEYDYAKTYGELDFSGSSLDKLIHGLTTDEAAARSYQALYSAGDTGIRAMALGIVWPAYVCSIEDATKAEFHDCMCKDAKP